MNSNHSIDVEAERPTIDSDEFQALLREYRNTSFFQGNAMEALIAHIDARLNDRRTPVSGEVVEDFVLVPRKPTPEMLNALYVTPDFVGSTIIRHSVDKLPAAYDAMLAVAPLPVPRVGGNTNPETPQISAQGIDHAKLDELSKLIDGVGEAIAKNSIPGQPYIPNSNHRLGESRDRQKARHEIASNPELSAAFDQYKPSREAEVEPEDFLAGWQARGQQAGGAEE